MSKSIKISFRSMKQLKDVRSVVNEYLKEKIGEGFGHLEVAFNEAVNNAILHGCKDKKDGEITVKLKVIQDKYLIIRVKDPGDGFKGNEILKNINCTCPHPLLSERGRGIYLMKKATDYIVYNRSGNEVMLVKYLGRC